MLVIIGIVSALIVIAAIIIFSLLVMHRINKISPVDAIHVENRGERFSKGFPMFMHKRKIMPESFCLALVDVLGRAKRYIFLAVVYILGTTIMLATFNLKNSVISEDYLKYNMEYNYDFNVNLTDEEWDEVVSRTGLTDRWEALNADLKNHGIPAEYDCSDEYQIELIIEYQRQTLIASIAHGVKTPVANIRLYSSAICEGLYSDGIVNETGAMIAEKIENNAIKIEKLTKELLDTASSALVSYEPHTGFFYIKELIDSVKTEWTHRLSIKRIPFTAECIGNPIMESDKPALVSVISQLIENAVKYSNGTGISVTVLKDDENFIISVKSKGGLLPEKELPYIFRSFWRGSNAENSEGSGIGLFTASEIIKKLGGNIYAKRLTESDKMEFVIFL